MLLRNRVKIALGTNLRVPVTLREVRRYKAQMARPLVIDLPHKLGAEEAKRRIAGGIGGLVDHLPSGAQVQSAWTGDRMNLGVRAMNQEVSAAIDVEERVVRVEVLLPGALSFFARPIEALLRRKGSQLLEDKRGPE